MSTKYKGSALVVNWIGAGGTVDLTGDSRVLEINEKANQIDVTTRSDTAKSYLADYPDVTAKLDSLDAVAGSAANNNWDSVNIGDAGTLVWAPEGTAVGRRKRTLPATILGKDFNSPYDGAVAASLAFSSNGGTVTKAFY